MSAKPSPLPLTEETKSGLSRPVLMAGIVDLAYALAHATDTGFIDKNKWPAGLFLLADLCAIARDLVVEEMDA
jgi:hypothetical protein